MECFFVFLHLIYCTYLSTNQREDFLCLKIGLVLLLIVSLLLAGCGGQGPQEAQKAPETQQEATDNVEVKR